MKYKYLKGPVKSRRLGKSLGIDVIPNNICSYNCVYCEVGLTDKLTTERKEYAPVDKIKKEIDHFLKQKPEINYLTFSSKGEPTLHSKISEIIQYIKQNHPKYKIALLTNSSLFNNESVINEVTGVDLIIPSLDAVNEKTFLKLNRPHNTLDIKDIIDGLIKLRKTFKGEIWLEIFIVPGLNDNLQEIKSFSSVIDKIKPDLVQLNSLDRPAPEEWVKPVPAKRLNSLAQEISERINSNIDVIAVN
ncbi:MAG: radical SAM protein [Halanaerobiales bacterium]